MDGSICQGLDLSLKVILRTWLINGKVKGSKMYINIDWEQYPHSNFVEEFCGVEEFHLYKMGRSNIPFGYFHEVESYASLVSGSKKGKCLIAHTLWLTIPEELWEVFSDGMLHRGWKIKASTWLKEGNYVAFTYKNKVKDRSLYHALINESRGKIPYVLVSFVSFRSWIF